MSKKILNIVTYDRGGAGFAVKFLNNLLNEYGFESFIIAKEQSKKSNIFNTFFQKVLNRISNLILNYEIGKTDPNFCFLSYHQDKEYTSASNILNKITFIPDIIIIHWVADFINFKTINKLEQITKAKIYFAMMDASHLTGGCHYTWNCEGFKNNCSNCSAILDQKKKKIASTNLIIKQKNIPKSSQIIAFSTPDYNKAISSSLFKNKKVHKMFLPLDDKIFLPGDKLKARKYFNIDPNNKTLLFGSINVEDKRKGALIFLDSLHIFQKKIEHDKINPKNITLLVIGRDVPDDFLNFKLNVKTLGFLSQDEIVKAYQASDFYISSSIEDSGPLMVNQSIMCATPVVSFNVGVASDLIFHKNTGYISKYCNVEDLANGMYFMCNLSLNEHSEMVENCIKLRKKYLLSNSTIDKFLNVLSTD